MVDFGMVEVVFGCGAYKDCAGCVEGSRFGLGVRCVSIECRKDVSGICVGLRSRRCKETCL